MIAGGAREYVLGYCLCYFLLKSRKNQSNLRNIMFLMKSYFFGDREKCGFVKIIVTDCWR